MCGIAGYLDFNQHVPGPELMKRMLSRIENRGPDESGIYFSEHISLGNVRLSIIDLALGWQPMCSVEKDLWLVFNGEIFNYIELREELIQRGYTFRTTSDTEVLLLLYKEFGELCLPKLNGQFAFAVWDKKKEELFLARDRLGIRPLYYINSADSFVFGSEIKCIFEYPQISPKINYRSLLEIFTFWTTLTPNTIFENVFELPAGCYMIINRRSQRIFTYWQLEFSSGTPKHLPISKNSLEEFESLLSNSVNIRLRADVPVAAYLSGGIDSSTTTFFINKLKSKILNTYSIGFYDDEFDETSYQLEVSRWLSTSHSYYQCRNEDIALNFSKVVWHSETPLLRTGAVPMYLLSKNVNNDHIKVVITGEGADEILAGYNIFKEAVIREFWSRQPESRCRPLLLQKLYPYLSQFQSTNKNSLKFFFGYKLTETNSPFYSHIVRWNNNIRLKNFLSRQIQEEVKDYDPLEALYKMIPSGFQKWNLLSRAQWLETKLFMTGYLLSSQGDRVAMANSVEGRYPFLDHRLVEFCSRLPGNFKLNGLNEKYILKKLMSDKLPSSVINRPKQAYRAPVAGSFLSPGAPEYIRDYLSVQKINEFQIFNVDLVRNLLDRIKRNTNVTEIDNMALAGILSTQIIQDFYINKNEPYKRSGLKSNCRILSHNINN